MLAGREAQIEEEEAATGRPSVWASVYRLMRCPGSCSSGPYCWVDPHGKKHYKISGLLVESLVEYIETGNTVQSHEDVPEYIRRELYAAARQSHGTHKKATGASHHPVTVNVLLASNCPNCPIESLSHTGPSQASMRSSVAPLDIPGYLDEQVMEYCAWQQSRVHSSAWKADCLKACDVLIKNAIDLNLLCAHPDAQFLIDAGVLKGTAQRVVSDVGYWYKSEKNHNGVDEGL